MTSMLLVIGLCALIGSLVGLLAGLLGIGGGLIIVPFLLFLLPYFDITSIEQAFVVSVATSLATIIFTSFSSCRAHHQKQNVPWDITPWMMAGVALGAGMVGLFASKIDDDILKNIFAVAVVLIALKMMLSRNAPQSNRALPHSGVLTVIGSVLGGISSLIGIGGGALIVPSLTFYGVDMRKAIGCAAACGFAIAFFGSAGFIYSGKDAFLLADGFIGYVYLPATFGVILTSIFTAPIGAKLVHKLPVKTLKKVFAIFLTVVAAKMMFS